MRCILTLTLTLTLQFVGGLREPNSNREMLVGKHAAYEGLIAFGHISEVRHAIGAAGAVDVLNAAIQGEVGFRARSELRLGLGLGPNYGWV